MNNYAFKRFRLAEINGSELG